MKPLSTERPDIVVIGAGIVGITAALYLQNVGFRVLIVERGEVAKEASFGNAGALAFSDIIPLASPGLLRKVPSWLVDPLGPLTIRPAYLPWLLPWLFRFWRASGHGQLRRGVAAQSSLMQLAAKEWETLTTSLALSSMVENRGALELYESEKEWAASLASWQARADAQIAFEHVRGAALAHLQPGLSPTIKVGTFIPGWKSVSDPYEFASALFKVFSSRGGTFENHQVTRVSTTSGGVEVLLANGGCINADKAVISAGAWSAALARNLGDRIPLETERGYNITLPLDACDVRLQLTFVNHGFVVTHLSSGIRIGGAVEFAGLNAAPNFDRVKAIVRKAKRFLPGLRLGGGRKWMGCRPSLPDSLPAIGFSRATADVIYAFGHGHLGLHTSCRNGQACR